MSSDKTFLANIFDRLCANDPSLTSLNLANKQLNDTDIIKLSEALKVNHTLTKLYLDNNQIGANGAKALSEVLKINDTLRKLNLFHNCLGPTGAQYISEGLKVNRNLTELNLGNNRIDNEGAGFLSDALSVNCALITLMLFGNQIRNEGTKALHKALMHNTTLTTLNLDHNRIDDRAAIKLLIMRNKKHMLATFICRIILLAQNEYQPNSEAIWDGLPKEIKLHILTLNEYDNLSHIVDKTTQQIDSLIKFMCANGNECYTRIKSKEKVKLIGQKDNIGNHSIRFFQPKPASSSVEQLQPVAENQEIKFSFVK